MDKLKESVKKEKKAYIKCVVWDLDNTLWQGVLMEDDHVILKDTVIDIIKALDSRGILQSISSKNNHEHAMSKLKEYSLDEYFLYPQINWNPKSHSIKSIAQSINIGLDSIAFIDDQEFELEEVRYSLPEVTVINAKYLDSLLDFPEFMPKYITEDSKKRRLMYIGDIARKKEEGDFAGPQEEFLASLNMTFTISIPEEGDLQRAEELTIRTHQLNTTGYTYSYEELNFFRTSKDHKLLIASLDDKFGAYGKIGVALIECKKDAWVIKLLLMSCRVMSRGVGSILINHIMQQAKINNVRLFAEFVQNDRNRTMYITYRFLEFTEIKIDGNFILLEGNLANIQCVPDYITVKVFD